MAAIVTHDIVDNAKLQWRKLLCGSQTNSSPDSVNTSNIIERPMTQANRWTNIHWGDELQKKSASHTRVYAQNVNGLQLDSRGGKFDSLCAIHKEVQADIFCGQEHNLDTTQMSIRSILYDTARQHWDKNKMVFGTTPILFKSQYKPGGTFIMTTGNTVSKVKNQHQDKWGRWVIQEFSCSAGRTLVMLSAYQPVDKRSAEGNLTVASQHRSLLLQAGDQLNNPRTAFRRDLKYALEPYQTGDYDLLIMGDFNESFGADSNGMSEVANKFGLVNLMTSHHPLLSPPATYSRGTTCLDYALATSRVSHALQSVGYDAFNARLASDHRGYFLDFDTQALFGNPIPDLASPQHRQLSTSNIHQVTAYIDQKYDWLEKHNVFERAERLTYLGNRHAFAERIDKDIVAASIFAEKALPQFGEPAWSVALSTARRQVNMLNKLYSDMRRHRPLEDTLRQARDTMPSTWDCPTTIQQCSFQLKEYKRTAATIATESVVRRDQERQELIRKLEKSSTASDKKSAKRLRRLKKAEDIKQLFRKLKRVRNTQARKGVVRLEIPLHPDVDPKSCTEWTTVEVPEEIVQRLQERNRIHFGQAHGTPFTVPPLSNHLGFCGNGVQSEHILNGTHDLRPYSESVRLLLRHMQYTHEMAQDTSRPTISDEEFTDKLKVWAESTTTSPSGIHLGHYKVLIGRHSFSSDAPDEDLTTEFRDRRDLLNMKQQSLRKLHLTMINYALERGYSYSRWQTVANTILFKDKTNVRLDRTRVIHIYEADFNLALGVKWRAAMHQAEDLKQLNEGQYGSRPSRTAIEPVLIEELQCEISRATRKPVILTNYDATACYDRIIPSVGMLVSKKFGVSPSVTNSNAETLRLAEYRVRTELGISPTGYRHSPEHPIYGTGQGSANSPSIWCFLSSVMFDGYDSQASPATYSNPDRQTHVKLGMIGFVDDCNGQTNQFEFDGSSATMPHLVSQTQQNAQLWTDLLGASGGALELSKCSCHIMQWQFSLSGAPVLVPSFTPSAATITLRDSHTNVSQSMEILPPYTAHKTLGHYKAPIGNQKEQYRQLKAKSDESTSFLWKCPLTRLEAWTYYYACYLPSVGYPLSCSSLTKHQLDSIQRKAMSIIIPRCGFNRHTKQAILYGPLELGGASFRPLYMQQGIGQTTLFLRHWRKNSVAGKLLQIALRWFQVQAGVSYPILQQVSSPLPQLESKWIASLRTFLHSIGASIWVDNPGIPKLQRMHDVVLMDVIQSSARFTDQEIRKLNYCRLYLKAVTLSDITTVSGTSLDSSKLTGEISLQSSTHLGPEIYQERPSPSTWLLWKRANRLWSNPTGVLYQSLGDWVDHSIHTQRQQHFSYRLRDILWIRIALGYMSCIYIEQTLYRETSDVVAWEDLPDDAAPTEAHLLCEGIWHIQAVERLRVFHPISIPGTFCQYIANLPDWETELLQHTLLFSDPFTVCLALEHGGFRSVSDGSEWFKSQGSFGWTMSDDLGERVATGMGPARSRLPNSYRSEGYGLLSMLCFLHRIAEFTMKHEPWRGIVATDSQSLIDTIQGRHRDEPPPAPQGSDTYRKSLDPLDPEWDIVFTIQKLLAAMPGVVLQHIKGHQDRHTVYRRLPLLAQLNVDADALANKYQCELGSHQPDVLPTTLAGAHLIFPSGTVTAHYEASLRFQATAAPLQQYMMEKYAWTSDTFKTINWAAHGSSLKKHLSQRTHLVKFVHEILPTNSTLHRRDALRNRCPSCGVGPENWLHVIRCPSRTRVNWRDRTLESIAKQCGSIHTRPELRQLLVEALASWFGSSEPATPLQLDPDLYHADLRTLIRRQNLIGWRHVFLGRFCKEWSTIQDDYYATQLNVSKAKRRTGQQWQILIISELWKHWFSVWELRNKDQHGEDTTTRTQAARREVERTLIEMYDFRAHMEPSVQELLCAEVSDHFGKTVKYNQNWLAVHGPLVRISIKRAKEKAIQGVRSIRQYFLPR